MKKIKLKLKNANNIKEDFVNFGDDYVCNKYELSKREWQMYFEHEVLQNNFAMNCVLIELDFFKEIFAAYGAGHVRNILNLQDEKFSDIWEQIFDFLAIAHELIFSYVKLNFRSFSLDENLQKELGLEKEKYLPTWQQVLVLLQKLYVDSMNLLRNEEEIMRFFSLLYSAERTQRRIN